MDVKSELENISTYQDAVEAKGYSQEAIDLFSHKNGNTGNVALNVQGFSSTYDASEGFISNYKNYKNVNYAASEGQMTIHYSSAASLHDFKKLCFDNHNLLTGETSRVIMVMKKLAAGDPTYWESEKQHELSSELSRNLNDLDETLNALDQHYNLLEDTIEAYHAADDESLNSFDKFLGAAIGYNAEKQKEREIEKQEKMRQQAIANIQSLKEKDVSIVSNLTSKYGNDKVTDFSIERDDNNMQVNITATVDLNYKDYYEFRKYLENKYENGKYGSGCNVVYDIKSLSDGHIMDESKFIRNNYSSQNEDKN